MHKLSSKISLVVVCLTISGCATSPAGFKEQEPDFERTINSANRSGVAECLLSKIESYPVMSGFEFEDRTLPVQIRHLNGRSELYQMQSAWIVSLIELKTISPTKMRGTLRLNHTWASYDRTFDAYKAFMESCSK